MTGRLFNCEGKSVPHVSVDALWQTNWSDMMCLHCEKSSTLYPRALVANALCLTVHVCFSTLKASPPSSAHSQKCVMSNCQCLGTHNVQRRCGSLFLLHSFPAFVSNTHRRGGVARLILTNLHYTEVEGIVHYDCGYGVTVGLIDSNATICTC